MRTSRRELISIIGNKSPAPPACLSHPHADADISMSAWSGVRGMGEASNPLAHCLDQLVDTTIS